MNQLSWRTAGLTDCGLQRSENQDNFFISSDHRVFVVADGMGGAEGGALASHLAVEAMRTCWTDAPPPLNDGHAIKQWLLDSVIDANMSVLQTARDGDYAKNMGTTIVAAVQGDDGHLHVVHVGDSRAYLFRDNRAVALTVDHSIVMEMYMRGQLTYQQYKDSPLRHIISRCLGHDQEIEIDYTSVELQPGDWILLASDGLSSVVDDEQLSNVIDKKEDPETVCKALLSKTFEKNAPDNVTIISIWYYISNLESRPCTAAAAP